jgi:hypothetical protein
MTSGLHKLCFIRRDKKPICLQRDRFSRVAFVKQSKPYGMFDKARFFLAAAAIGTAMNVMEKEMVRMWGSEPCIFELDNPMNKRLVSDFMKPNRLTPLSPPMQRFFEAANR